MIHTVSVNFLLCVDSHVLTSVGASVSGSNTTSVRFSDAAEPGCFRIRRWQCGLFVAAVAHVDTEGFLREGRWHKEAFLRCFRRDRKLMIRCQNGGQGHVPGISHKLLKTGGSCCTSVKAQFRKNQVELSFSGTDESLGWICIFIWCSGLPLILIYPYDAGDSPW